MSQVNSEARGKQKFEAIIEARRLCKYSLHILKNNDNFKCYPSGNEEDDRINPPQPELVAELRNTILTAYKCAYSANDTPFTKGNYVIRRKLQDKSIAMLREMLALIELSADVFHMSGRKKKFWAERTILVRNLIQAWKESDYRRYKRK